MTKPVDSNAKTHNNAASVKRVAPQAPMLSLAPVNMVPEPKVSTAAWAKSVLLQEEEWQAESSTADNILVAQAQGASASDAAGGIGAGATVGAEAAGAATAGGAGAVAGTAAAGAAASSPVLIVAVGGLGLAAAAGGGGGGGAAASSAVVAAVPVTIGGKVADGYVRGAKIYIDENGNGIADTAEDTGVVTDATGGFSLTTTKKGPIIAVGGVNIDTGIANTLVLKAPSGSSIINPVTTMIQGYVASHPGATAETAETAIQNSLGLPNVDLLTYDPLSAADANSVAVQRTLAQLASILTLAASDPKGGTATDADKLATMDAVIANLLKAVGDGTGAALDLSVGATLDLLLSDGAGGSLTDIPLATISAAAVALESAVDLSAITNAQGQSLDTLKPVAPTAAPDLAAASDSGTSATDNITNNRTPTVRVTINTTASDGTAAVAGNAVKVYSGAELVASVALTATDITNGYVDVTVNTLAEGAQSLTATITDTAANTGDPSSPLSITIDATPPALAVSAVGDAVKTAAEAGAGVIDINAETGAEVTAVFTGAAGSVTKTLTGNGSVQSIALTGSDLTTLGEGAVTVQTTAIDAAGNSANSSTGGFSLDSAPPALTVAVVGDANKSVSDATNAAGVLSVTAEAGTSVGVIFTGTSGSVSKTLSGNGSAQTVALTSADLTALGAGAVSVTTSVADAAGNITTSSTGGFSLDSVAPALTVTLSGDVDKTAAEASIALGALSVTTESGADVSVVLTGQSGVVTKTLTGTGSAQSVVLTSGDLATLGEGAVTVLTTAVDAAGNPSTSTSGGFNLDTHGPTLTVTASTDADKTAAEAALGVLNVNAETGASVSVVFAGTSGTVTKAVTGNGAAQSVTLAAGDITTLGQGVVTVSTTATDVAGNTANDTTGGFNLDSVAPVFSSAEVNGKKLTLTYTESTNALDGAQLPSTSAFTVRVNGNAVMVSSVEATGNKMTVTLANSVANGSTVNFDYSASGVNAIQDVAGNDAASLTAQSANVPNGTLADGYIRDAKIYIDANNNGIADPDENTGILEQMRELSQQELDMNMPLLKSGDVSRAEILKLQRQVADLAGQIVSKRNKFMQEVQTDQAKAQEDLSGLVQIMAQRKDELDLTEVRAPMDGVVRNVRMTTLGGVARPGDELMQIVPVEDSLVIEAKVKTADIGFLRVNLPATVKLDAYDYSIYGTLLGHVTFISADTLTEQLGGQEVPYYRVHVKIDHNNMKPRQGEKIDFQPGMTSTVEIKTGEKTVWDYVTKPITKTLDEALRER